MTIPHDVPFLTVTPAPDGAPFVFHETLRRVAAAHGLTPAELLARTRMKHISHARWDVFAILRKRGWSYPQIARKFGLDHTTVLYGVRARSRAIAGQEPCT